MWGPQGSKSGPQASLQTPVQLNHLSSAGLDGSEIKPKLMGGERGRVSLPPHACPSCVQGRLCRTTVSLGLST